MAIPKMRTATGIVAEIRKDDPDTAVTEYHVRMLLKSGRYMWCALAARCWPTWTM